MAELSDADKERIVVLLGRFKKPADIVAIMREEHGVETDVDQVTRYNPQHTGFRAERDRWEPIFNAARDAYINDLKQVIVANQSWRLNELNDLYDRAKKAKNYKLAAELLEQISRECGGSFTNQRELKVDGRRAREMNTEDRAAMLGSIIAEAMDKAKQTQPEQPTKH